MTDKAAAPSILPAQSAEKVRLFFDTLAAGENPGNQEFGRVLLSNVKSSVRRDDLQASEIAQYDLLLEIARQLLETELEDALFQFQRKGINQKEFAALCAPFWGALVIHIEIFLRQPQVTSRSLISERNGEYIVTLDGRPPYKFRETLSTAKVQSLLVTLGKPWLDRYLGNYVSNNKSQEHYRALAERQVDLFGWMANRSRQTLNLAQNKLCVRLWKQHSSPVIVGYDASGNSTLRDFVARAFAQAQRKQPEKAQMQAWQDALINTYTQKLDEFLASQETQPFFMPDVQVEDDWGKHLLPSLEDLVDIQGMCLLIGLPGVGKSRIQAWIARKRLSEDKGLDIFLDLAEYVKSGHSSAYEFVAAQWIQAFGALSGFEELRSLLIELDSKKLLYWHTENMDQISEHEQARLFLFLTRLSNVLLSTSDPESLIELARDLSIKAPLKIYRILPFSSEQQSQYIETLGLPHDKALRVSSVMKQLPGLASLPAGMAAIAKDPSGSIIDMLLRYLDAQQKARNDKPVRLSLKQKRNTCYADWHNPYVNSVYEIVSALQKFGPAKQYDVSRLEEMDAIALGAHLYDPNEDMEAKIKRAERLFKGGCRGGLLYRTEDGKYSFVAPDMGYLMAAISVYAAHSKDFILKEALDFSARHPGDSSAQILLAFAGWFNENCSLDPQSSLKSKIIETKETAAME